MHCHPEPDHPGAKRARGRVKANEQRDRLVSDPKHLRLVRAIAKHVHGKLPPSFDLGDLIAVGNLALLNAAEQYDTERAVPFPMFARQAIRGAMLDSVRRNKYTENTRTSIDDPGAGAGKCGVDGYKFEGEYDDIERYGPPAARAMLHMATRPTPEISIDRGRLSERIRAAIDQLAGEQRQVLGAAFFDDLSITQIGIRFGIPRGRARKLRTDAIAAVRAELTKKEISL
jgi:RNA polymerase sigma factor (sigma-70 family)